jgi:hypothetical protein
VREVGDDETYQQACVLGDEVEAHFASDEEGEDSCAFGEVALACWGIVPD